MNKVEIIKAVIATLEKICLLKYNYFTQDHPDIRLRGKLFKFVGDDQVQLLKTKQLVKIDKSDLEKGGKKLYSPADMS